MTVKECYEQAVSLIPEKPEENVDMQKFAVIWCNILLAETLCHENILRKEKNLQEIEKVPQVESENDEIPFDFYNFLPEGSFIEPLSPKIEANINSGVGFQKDAYQRVVVGWRAVYP